MATATSNLDGLPRVTVTSGGTGYTATVEILGINPGRTISAEERFSGITSLNPPTVKATDRHTLIRRAIRATLSAIAATDDNVTPAVIVKVAHGVDFAARNAFEALGEGA